MKHVGMSKLDDRRPQSVEEHSGKCTYVFLPCLIHIEINKYEGKGERERERERESEKT